jgi:hypothetical protein
MDLPLHALARACHEAGARVRTTPRHVESVLDRRRKREACARRDEFRRYTWADVVDQPLLTVAELRRLLG